MIYLSTHGQAPQLRFSEILLGGLASDGGLYVPERYPRFSEAELAAMRGMNYRELAFEVLSRLIDDIPHDDLRALIDKTYTADVYRYVNAGENAEDITPLKTLGVPTAGPWVISAFRVTWISGLPSRPWL